MKLTFIGLATTALILPTAIHAQSNISVKSATLAEGAALVDHIVDAASGITIGAITLIASPPRNVTESDGFISFKRGSSGFFNDTNASPVFGPKFASGIVLSTGTIQSIVGPNNIGDAGTNNPLTAGDTDLDAISPSGASTFDATVLEFEFQCPNNDDIVSLEYAFGSEEYLESINKEFTDVFAVFLNGVNIATIPDPVEAGVPPVPVSINTVNCLPGNRFCPFFVDNLGEVKFDTQLDGYTTPLVASGLPLSGVSNTLKIAIADTAEEIIDSAIVIAANSLKCSRRNGNRLPSPGDGGAQGDPHFKTWRGQHYDFHGACDLVLLKSSTFESGLGLDVHIRTKMKRDMSYISSAALRIGEDILEVASKGVYYLNGVEGAELPSEFSGFPFSHTQPNAIQHVFEIYLGGRERVKIKTYKDFVSVLIEQAQNEHFGDSAGLMGEFEGGHMIARDGKTVLEDPNAFGLEWQVRDTEPMLFQDARFPQYPQACTLPLPKLASQLRRRLSEVSIDELAAKKACAHWGEGMDDCIFDVLATGDLNMASADSY